MGRLLHTLDKNAAVLLDYVGEYLLGAWWGNIKFLALGIMLTSFTATAGEIVAAAIWMAKHVARGTTRIALSAWEFAKGRRTAHDVRRAVAGGTPDIQWAGASAPEPYSLDFIRDRVRGRGERTQPLDLVIEVDGALARLARGCSETCGPTATATCTCSQRSAGAHTGGSASASSGRRRATAAAEAQFISAPACRALCPMTRRWSMLAKQRASSQATCWTQRSWPRCRQPHVCGEEVACAAGSAAGSGGESRAHASADVYVVGWVV